MKYMVAIMQAHSEGKQVQQKSKKAGSKWLDVKQPSWNWDKNEYRIALSREQELFEELNGVAFIKTTIRKGATTMGGQRITLEPNFLQKLFAGLEINDTQSFILIPLSNKLKNIVEDMNS